MIITEIQKNEMLKVNDRHSCWHGLTGRVIDAYGSDKAKALVRLEFTINKRHYQDIIHPAVLQRADQAPAD